MRHRYSLVLLLTLLTPPLLAQTITAFTAGMDKRPGFLTFYWDAKKGKIWLEIDKFGQELLYYPTLAQGVGSNDIGLDRGRLGAEHVVTFERSGNKVLMIEPNYGYRALSRDSLERRAVAESFAQSVHAGFEIVAEEGNDPNRRVLVDLTPFLLQDAVGAVQAISQTKQGTFKVDASRCALYLPRTKAFPKNTEFEATITLAGDAPGPYLRQVVPTPTAVTMRQHHSFVELPPLDGSYTPRLFDPRSGLNNIEFFDYASPVSQPIQKRYITRHRLAKKDPSAAISDPVKPIIYYMDPGAPEPIRSALMEGTSWWNQAFEAAGYRNAFQVRLLPADADPMDIRYNVIQWVHRSTRGWSYGASITDPRTGEILKGKVTLGSLRVRQDYLIAQGLMARFENNAADTAALMPMALARLRQLAAHEVGHTLGLPHNYIASTVNRSSVMDYPHPQVTILAGNKLSLDSAYARGIGEWDKAAITYGYQDFPKGTNEKTALDALIQAYLKRGLKFLSDQDARPEGSAHPQTHLWDAGGTDAVAELSRTLNIRQIALDNFSASKIPVGTPMANLEEVLVPMYMFHRYQVEATSKVLGGVSYSYALRGDGQPVVETVPADRQRRALAGLITTLDPKTLAVPKAILDLIPPRAFGYDPNPREVFKRHTGLTFDPMGPPEAAANLTLRLLLNPERCARLLNQKAQNPAMPGMTDMLKGLIDLTFKPQEYYKGEARTYAEAIQQMTSRRLLESLIALATDKDADSRVRAVAHDAIQHIRYYFVIDHSVRSPLNHGSDSQLLWLIRQYETNPQQPPVTSTALAAPDGAPIEPGYDWLDCEK
ncbi:zinc-dependent metalloprotease [Fibrella sp. HMF5335]|uniref:Zinc-dependent metalloprotease n=1 Tax=Fibrella rubiginis TaxID=2817060 RepID=A0A939GBV0_9BACT|nr:zinc-dependent metalloprotease [Fibrella rubiginis]MBO0935491.1 zinc-dependent metalloprotease [Fibrella rubiginis]